MQDQINEELTPVVYVSTWRKSFDIPPYGYYSIDASITEYIEKVQLAGGIALQIPRDDPRRVGQILAGADALLLIGGADVDPSLYGQPNTGSHGTDSAADAFEIALVIHAQKQGLPLFAVCRGQQVLNVALGGTLEQDIDQSAVIHSPPPAAQGETGSVNHEITIDKTSMFLGDILGTHATVNSIHHQAVATCAPGMRVVARSDDGVIEAIEPEDTDWIALSVQWHPEKMERGQLLFNWFLDRVRSKISLTQ
jgi:putative glutamine amidotransferase